MEKCSFEVRETPSDIFTGGHRCPHTKWKMKYNGCDSFFHLSLGLNSPPGSCVLWNNDVFVGTGHSNFDTPAFSSDSTFFWIL